MRTSAQLEAQAPTTTVGAGVVAGVGLRLLVVLLLSALGLITIGCGPPN